MIEVGKTYGFGRLWDDAAECIFVVVAEEPYRPKRSPSGYIPGPGFRILILDGEIHDAIHGPTKAGQETLVAATSAIACDAKPF